MRKSSMLQRQISFNAQEINGAHERIKCFKYNRKIAYEKDDSINAELFSRFVNKDEKYVKQLAELQVFLKDQLQEAYDDERWEVEWENGTFYVVMPPVAQWGYPNVEDYCGNYQYKGPIGERFDRSVDYKHSPKFMAEAPAAEMGSFAEDECEVPPKGWYCTRKAGHSGPCAAYPEGKDND